MSSSSTIEWTDATWNPTRGCVKISPGCKHCYAELFAERWRGIAGHPYELGFTPRLVPEKLNEPLKWRRPRRVFVNSMSDLFADFVPDGYVMDVVNVIGQSHVLGHTFQILTKRADRMRAWFDRWADVEPWSDDSFRNARGPAEIRAAHTTQRALLFAEMLDRWGTPPDGAAFPSYDWQDGPRYWDTAIPNAWLGVSVEDRAYGLPRIDELRRIDAAVRFLSIEPLLEDIGELDLTGIHWVIVGGESGPGARPMKVEWVRSIRDQCDAARVPFFFKQWGGVLKKRHGRELDGRTHDAFPDSSPGHAPFVDALDGEPVAV